MSGLLARRRGDSESSPRWAAIAGLLAVGLLSAGLRAEEAEAVELHWTAPNGCPSESALRERIAALVPTPGIRPTPLVVTGQVSRRDAHFALDLVLADGELSERRRFEGDSCDEVVGAAAVAVALLLKSPGAERGSPSAGDAGRSEARSAAPPNQTAASPNEGALPADEHREAALPWRVVVQAPALSLGSGFLDPPSVGASGGLGLERAGWRVMFSGTWHLDLDFPVREAPDVTARVTRQTGRLWACRWVLPGTFQLGACATLGVHRLGARASGPGIASSLATYTWAMFGPYAVARYRLSDFVGFGATLGLDLQAAHPALTVSGLGDVAQIGAVEGNGVVGVEWIF